MIKLNEYARLDCGYIFKTTTFHRLELGMKLRSDYYGESELIAHSERLEDLIMVRDCLLISNGNQNETMVEYMEDEYKINICRNHFGCNNLVLLSIYPKEKLEQIEVNND